MNEGKSSLTEKLRQRLSLLKEPSFSGEEEEPSNQMHFLSDEGNETFFSCTTIT